MSSLMIIDGSGFLFRSFHALPPLSTSAGVPVGAMVGFANMLLRVQDQHATDHCVVALDKGRCTFRMGIDPHYKKNRPDIDPDIIQQFDLVRAFCAAYGMPILESEGIEADDLIATAAYRAEKAGWDVIVVSSDKDLGQVVNEKVRMYDPVKRCLMGPKEIQDLWGVAPPLIPHVQALAGDASDGIPGLPGVGIKTALQWIQSCGSLEALLAHPGQVATPKKQEIIRQHADIARMCYRLALLRHDVDVPTPFDRWFCQCPDPKVFNDFLTTYEMFSLRDRLAKKKIIVLDQNPVNTDSVRSKPHTLSIEPVHSQAVDWSCIGKARSIAWLWDADAAQMVVCWGDRNVGRLSVNEARLLWNDPNYLKILYDAKSWIIWAEQRGWGDDLGHFDDVMVMSCCAYGGHVEHRLWDVLARSCQTTAESLSAQDLSLDQQVYILFHGHDFFYHMLRYRHSMMAYMGVDRPLITVLSRMERHGVWVDRTALMDLSQKWEKILQALEQSIIHQAGISFHVASPKQLGTVLFDSLKWPYGKKGKSGAYNTSSSVLQTLATEGYELASTILEWRKLNKLQSTYTKTLADQVDRQTGRLHTTYSMVSTSTGRLSSVHPNVQNIPVRTPEGRLIRHAFGAPSGYGLLCLDYSQIELRLLAHMGHIAALQKAFQDNVDIHRQTASDIFACELKEVTPEQRRLAKIINFGLIYGMSAFGLAQQLSIPVPDASDIIDRYFKTYEGVKAYIDRCKSQARRHGYVTTLWGRRCFIPGIMASNTFVRSGAERQAINAPLQGTNADLIKNAMVRIDDYIRRYRLPVSMVLQVHDELILQVPTDSWEVMRDQLSPLMQGVADLSVPLSVNASFDLRWR